AIISASIGSSCSNFDLIMLIRHKLAVSSGLLVLLMGVGGTLCLMLIANVRNDLVQANTDLVPHSASATRMVGMLLETRADAQDLIRCAYEARQASASPAEMSAVIDEKMKEMEKPLGKLQEAIAECRTIINNNGLPAAVASGDPEEVQSEYDELKKLA